MLRMLSGDLTGTCLGKPEVIEVTHAEPPIQSTALLLRAGDGRRWEFRPIEKITNKTISHMTFNVQLKL